jgi:hypothetical protein
MGVSKAADTPNVPARVENLDPVTAEAKGVEPVDHPPARRLPAELFVSEGTRQELVGGSRAFDPATGRELVLDESGTVRFKG